MRALANRRLRPSSARLPSRTVRLRLTLVYAGLFLACGAALLAITYVLVRRATASRVEFSVGNGSTIVGSTTQSPNLTFKNGGVAVRSFTFNAGAAAPSGKPLTPAQMRTQARQLQAQAEHQRAVELHQLLEQSGIALAIMAAVSILLGWLAAGRVLRPLRTLAERAREISASSLHKRLALSGPDDEITHLAATFDDLLGRLESAFAAQRQFVANASHELRTPLTLERALLETALTDPDATVDTFRATAERLVLLGEQQERLIEALLTLARSERGIDERAPVDLAAIADHVVRTLGPEAARRDVAVEALLEPAETAGDARLAERLVANLVDNAIRHNVAGGRVEVVTTSRAGRASLAVTNTGPVVPPEAVPRLFLPFQRLGADRTDHGDGVGLGLSIVSAIAAAHGASVSGRPRPGGGLVLQVGFPV